MKYYQRPVLEKCILEDIVPLTQTGQNGDEPAVFVTNCGDESSACGESLGVDCSLNRIQFELEATTCATSPHPFASTDCQLFVNGLEVTPPEMGPGQAASCGDCPDGSVMYTFAYATASLCEVGDDVEIICPGDDEELSCVPVDFPPI